MRLRKLRYLPFVARRAAVRAFPTLPKLRPDRLAVAVLARRHPDRYVFVDWNPRDRNWGDALNRSLVEHLTERRSLSSRLVLRPRGVGHYVVVGSVLGMNSLDGSVIWGAGFMTESDVPRGVPDDVAALRGPLSAELLGRDGIHIPADVAFGDPAILMPLIYRPLTRPRYTLGVVPHYADAQDPRLAEYHSHPDVLVIDVTQGTRTFIDQLSECRIVASSSLHGIIAADAYGLPRVWVEFGDRVTGAGFKFRDYAAGARLEGHPETALGFTTRISSLLDAANRYPIDKELQGDLLRCCPLPIAPPVERRLLAALA